MSGSFDTAVLSVFMFRAIHLLRVRRLLDLNRVFEAFLRRVVFIHHRWESVLLLIRVSMFYVLSTHYLGNQPALTDVYLAHNFLSRATANRLAFSCF